MVNIHLYGLKKEIGNNTHYFLGQVLTAQIWQKPLKVSKTWLSIKPEKIAEKMKNTIMDISTKNFFLVYKFYAIEAEQ